MGGVVNILVRQVKGDDLAVVGVNAYVQLAPSAALCRAMFFKQPFAGPAQFQSRTVDDQVKFARSNPREVANRQMISRRLDSAETASSLDARPVCSSTGGSQML